jgi:hypothetical protein
MNGGAEPLFIKNLENVQGDERDVIFISATYGPDAKGNQYQRFGPINGPNGHRRLNVLFTRAKKRVEVFSALDPDRIQTTSSSAWGQVSRTHVSDDIELMVGTRAAAFADLGACVSYVQAGR